jgi:NADH-quinone oxidoreductase subunit G
MEFLLINHPLDCPICDQGGECDLQDQAMAYGIDTTRYPREQARRAGQVYRPARRDQDEPVHPLHPVHPVRRGGAGVQDLGAIGRGEDMEITTYLETAMQSELQGNVADLCPVGALVHKPQNYNMRPGS